ncbi:hypothetical protein [Micromonospora sp. NBC_01813]|uniref:hypothetical protein n=1 Tax=Micromonospora sp. NBC_01813 TaxID=2975988 RepID=UPI002DD81DC3|nr:hypothetical protein [Micromonospora sp. NBC_01813]WSA08059.1 hypothetical protein OG958_28250 [Micromonospora sp. NBC_01813]
MADQAPQTPTDRKLVWAPDMVRAGIAAEVMPQASQSLPQRLAQAARLALIFTWLPAFVVFAATTLAAPTVTNEASVAAAALWALLVAALIAGWAVVTELWRWRAGRPDEAAPETPTRPIALRLLLGSLPTAVFTSLVLALHGLSVGQIAVLAGLLVAVLHLLPLLVARLLTRRRQASPESSPDPVP